MIYSFSNPLNHKQQLSSLCFKGWIVIMIFSVITGCTYQSVDYKEEINASDYLRRSVQQLTDVIVFDIFSPPVASRVYAYPSIAAYETLVPEHSDFLTLAGQLNGLSPIPAPDTTEEINLPIASIHAFLATGKALVFSEDRIDEFESQLTEEFRTLGVPKAVIERSFAYGELVSKHILAWSKEDNYHETRSFPKFTVSEDPARWKPTPPAYMDGIEPHWNKIRPFVIDSATQFIPVPPTEFNMDDDSDFYSELMEVYEVGNTLTEEQREIASFWDCNPYVMNVTGHVMFATKKITPGGHWISITSIVTEQAKSDVIETAEAYALVSIALADAFISCWDEKYRSSLIRPETLINQHVDPDWVPLLQTPPFPEYTSGHSVISRAAAVTLTDLFGESYHFIDSSEVDYGLPPRTFDSFIEASEEAAISRLFGGIHYMPAIENGVKQGEKVGDFIVSNIQTRKGKATNEEVGESVARKK